MKKKERGENRQGWEKTKRRARVEIGYLGIHRHASIGVTVKWFPTKKKKSKVKKKKVNKSVITWERAGTSYLLIPI